MESYVVKKGLRMVLIKKMWAGEAPKVPAKIHILAGFHWFSLLFRPLDLHGRGFKCPGGAWAVAQHYLGVEKCKKSQWSGHLGTGTTRKLIPK